MGGTCRWLRVPVFAFLFCISGWVNGADTAQPPLTALSLSVEEPAGTAQNRPLLQRELIRQAILIAAREEIGAATRDQLLEDRSGPVPDGAVQLDVHILAGSPAHVSILRKARQTSRSGLAIWRAWIGTIGRASDCLPNQRKNFRVDPGSKRFARPASIH